MEGHTRSGCSLLRDVLPSTLRLTPRGPHAPDRIASNLSAIVGAIAVVLAPAPAHALVQVCGNFVTTPGGLPIGPGNTDLGSASLEIGSNGAGTLTVNGGSLFDLGTLSMATGGTGSAVGEETHVLDDLAAAFDLAGRLRAGVQRIQRLPVSARELCHVGAPLAWVELRAQDGS